MKDGKSFNRALVIAGTALVWLPLLAPVILMLVSAFQRGRLLFDFLMPAELFPVVLAGGLMLLWAALRTQNQRRLVAGCLGLGVALLFGGQGLAVVTGLASGETPIGGWQFYLVSAMIAGYALCAVGMGVGGILLLTHLFRRTPPAPSTAN